MHIIIRGARPKKAIVNFQAVAMANTRHAKALNLKFNLHFLMEIILTKFYLSIYTIPLPNKVMKSGTL